MCFVFFFPFGLVFPQDAVVEDSPTIVGLPGFGFHINSNNQFKISQENRFYINIDEKSLSYEEFDLSLRIFMGQINNFSSTMTLSYLHTFDNKLNTNQYRPMYYLTGIYSRDKFYFSIRNRFEYLVSVHDKNNFRYRPRIKLGLIFKFQDVGIFPYIYDELFFNDTGFEQHRIQLGYSMRYKEFQVHLGNLLKFDSNNDFIENRLSFRINYRIRFKKDRKVKNTDGVGVDPLYP